MRSLIESASNKKIKLVRELHQRKYRNREGLFLAEGVRLSEMAVHSDWRIEFALFTKEMAAEARGEKLLCDLEEKGCMLYEVPKALYDKVSDTESPQGVLLVMEKKAVDLQALLQTKKTPFFLVLDGVQDPGNAGTILRTADAAGADGVILLKGSVDMFSDKAVRSAMGSLFHLPICENVEREAFIKAVEGAGIPLFATALDETARLYTEADLKNSAAIVFGNEGNGVSEEILLASKKLYIPMYGSAESLNVAAASAIVIYEAVRQRNMI